MSASLRLGRAASWGPQLGWNRDAQDCQDVRYLPVELKPNRGDAGVTQPGEDLARLIDDEDRVVVGVAAEQHAQWGVQHDDGVAAEHPFSRAVIIVSAHASLHSQQEP